MLITNSKDLEYFCNEFSKDSFIAVDTEFMRNKTYYPTLSLIQIAGKKNVVIIDMLKKLNFAPLISLLQQRNLLKIFHSAKQDCEAIFHNFNLLPSPIFDTQISAFFCGFSSQLGYDKLVKYFLSLNISKKLQYSNWLLRPLSDAQYNYAINEVTHLLRVYSVIKDKLNNDDHRKLNWIQEECNYMFSEAITSANNCIKRYFYFTKDIEILLFIQSVLTLRENKAKELNIPRERVYTSKQIEKILFYIMNHAQTKWEFFLTKYLFYQKKTYATEFQKIYSHNQNNVKSEILTKIDLYNQKRSMIKNTLYNKLQDLLLCISKSFNIGSSIIATSNDLLKYANGFDSKITKNWRYDVFGQYAKQIKRGVNTVSLNNKSIFRC